MEEQQNKVSQSDFDQQLKLLQQVAFEDGMAKGRTVGEIGEALAQAQGELEDPVKTRTAKVVGTTKAGKRYEYTYRYATLADGLVQIRKVLSKNGIAVVQTTELADERMMLRTTLLHKSGAALHGLYPIANLASNQNLTPQDIGAALTYARRYALFAIVGIAPEDDDDANEATGNKATITDNKRKPEVDEDTEKARKLFDHIRKRIAGAETIEAYHEVMAVWQQDIDMLKKVTETGYNDLMARAAKKKTDLENI